MKHETIITNVNTGICQHRAQFYKPCYFVNWREDGKQQYEFFEFPFGMYRLYNRS